MKQKVKDIWALITKQLIEKNDQNFVCYLLCCGILTIYMVLILSPFSGGERKYNIHSYIALAIMLVFYLLCYVGMLICASNEVDIKIGKVISGFIKMLVTLLVTVASLVPILMVVTEDLSNASFGLWIVVLISCISIFVSVKLWFSVLSPIFKKIKKIVDKIWGNRNGVETGIKKLTSFLTSALYLAILIVMIFSLYNGIKDGIADTEAYSNILGNLT